jgi:hypothetical protein
MELLDRLHRRLLASSSARTDDGAGSFEVTVGDLYQQLIPYRAIRTEVGAMELAEYEHALLRLLSGEREYVEIAEPGIRAEIQRELASLNPILGIYRDYAAALVTISARSAAGDESGGAGMPAAPPLITANVGTSTAAEPADPESTASAASAEAAPAPADPGPHPEERHPAAACRSCRRDLAPLADLIFCPFCGVEQATAPCIECGTSLDPSWRFCIRCGTPRD